MRNGNVYGNRRDNGGGRGDRRRGGGGGRGRGGNRNRGRGGGNGGGRGRGRRGDRRRGGGGGGGRRRSADSGNRRERIAIESGYLVLIDQFMLANPQFIDQLIETVDEEPEVKDELISKYGGGVVQLEPGTYRIQRDPYAYTIVIHPQGERVNSKEVTETASDEHGQVYVDTRCLAMIDRELLDDSGLLEKYKQLWFGGQDKACRDLLRDNGGAVRYGFSRLGDELGIYSVPEENIVCLWPDIAEPGAQESAEGDSDQEGDTEEAAA